jgi:SPP1 family predicted phage head-tail adaptor
MPLRRMITTDPNSIGAINRQITVFAPGTRNVTDGGTLPPSPLFTSWASIRTLRGDELDRAQQIAQDVQHCLRIPYQWGVPVTGDMTVGFEKRTFQIRYIADPDEMHTWLDLYCAEVGQNAGGS